MAKALIIPTAEGESITECEVNKLEDYQTVVGGWIEPVDIPALGVTVYVHEEGLMLDLPFNPRATFLWWYFVPEARQKAMLVGPPSSRGCPTVAAIAPTSRAKSAQCSLTRGSGASKCELSVT